MEFSSFIKRVTVNDVVLRRMPCGEELFGTLCVTGHHLIVCASKAIQQQSDSTSPSDKKCEVWLLHMNVDIVERHTNSRNNGGHLRLKCKDLRIFELEIRSSLSDFLCVAESIEQLSRLADAFMTYPFYYRADFKILEDGWTAFQAERELKHMIKNRPDLRISSVNQDYGICRSYPKLCVVPKTISDEEIIESAKFRHNARFPLISYLHGESCVALVRTSQPLCGVSNKRCREDEKLLNSFLRPTQRAYIIDLRSSPVAQSEKQKGGGFESEQNYSQWKRLHRCLEKYSGSALRDIFGKLVEACHDRPCPADRWLTKLANCGWLDAVQLSLDTACMIAQLISFGHPVVIHGSEGRDMELVLSSLAQVILNPDTRTIRGFEALIEREWLSAGHPFATRHNASAYHFAPSATVRKPGVTDCSPTFLLFLDCLYQIHHQFSLSFEFIPRMLEFFFEHSYASQFGTFMLDCPAERDEQKLSEKTISLWSYLNTPQVLDEYLSPVYEPNPEIIWPSVAPPSIETWKQIYMRGAESDESLVEQEWLLAKQLRKQMQELKSEAVELRNTMVELEAECEEKKIETPNPLDAYRVK